MPSVASFLAPASRLPSSSEASRFQNLFLIASSNCFSIPLALTAGPSRRSSCRATAALPALLLQLRGSVVPAGGAGAALRRSSSCGSPSWLCTRTRRSSHGCHPWGDGHTLPHQRPRRSRLRGDRDRPRQAATRRSSTPRCLLAAAMGVDRAVLIADPLPRALARGGRRLPRLRAPPHAARAGRLHPRPQGLPAAGAGGRLAGADPAAGDRARRRGGADAARGRAGCRHRHRVGRDRAGVRRRAAGPAGRRDRRQRRSAGRRARERRAARPRRRVRRGRSPRRASKGRSTRWSPTRRTCARASGWRRS